MRWFGFSLGTLVGGIDEAGKRRGWDLLWCYRSRQLKCMLYHPATQWLVIVAKMYNNTWGMTPLSPKSPAGFAAHVTFDLPVYKVYIYFHISLNKVLFKMNKQGEKKKRIDLENSILNARGAKTGSNVIELNTPRHLLSWWWDECQCCSFIR